MQISFNPPSGFNALIQEKLKNMAERAFAACKLQFVSDKNHVLPNCNFYIGGGNGNTGGLSGIQLTFESEQHLYRSETAVLERLIHHEMVHFFQSHLHCREPYEYLPVWFYEGMAVAFSGQGLIARNSHLDEDYKKLGGNLGWRRFYLMDKYRALDYTKPPYDVLYDSWGAIFIYAVTDQPSIFPCHAVRGSDSFLYSSVGEAECAKALVIIETASKIGFDAALEQHTGRKQILESDVRRFLAPD